MLNIMKSSCENLLKAQSGQEVVVEEEDEEDEEDEEEEEEEEGCSTPSFHGRKVLTWTSKTQVTVY
jgi:hypothetical protein